MLSLRQLEVFRTVLLSGSFTEAGRRMQMSQPAVTKAVKRMEDQLGFALFTRARGRITPTLEAQRLEAEVEKVFHSVRVVEKFAVDLKEAQSGTLSIACTPTMACGFLASVIQRFRAKRPKVRVWLQVTTTREVLELAAKRQVDFGLIYAPANDDAVEVLPLFEAEVVCAMPLDHRLATRRTVVARELVDEPIITNVRNQPLHELIGLAFSGLDMDRSVMIGTNSTISACAMVRAGCGLAIVEPFGVAETFPELVLRPLSPRVPLTARIVRSPHTTPSRACDEMLREIRDALTV